MHDLETLRKLNDEVALSAQMRRSLLAYKIRHVIESNESLALDSKVDRETLILAIMEVL